MITIEIKVNGIDLLEDGENVAIQNLPLPLNSSQVVSNPVLHVKTRPERGYGANFMHIKANRQRRLGMEGRE